MANLEIRQLPQGAPEFVAFAVEQLTASLGEADPRVLAGRRLLAALATIPDGAVLVTEESLAAAIRRAWPVRRNTDRNLALSAASLLAALRTESRSG